MATSLRQRMTDDMRLRNFSPRTVEAYLLSVRLFAQFHKRPPDQLGSDEVRAFLLDLLHVRKQSPSSVNVASCALRFFFRHTLGREEVVARIPLALRGRRLPAVLSPEDVSRLLEAARSRPDVRTMLLLAYATGLRLGEVIALRVSDVDSSRQTIRVVQGKGRRDRHVLLSPALLEALREHWRR